jgi:hypothetical protein
MAKRKVSDSEYLEMIEGGDLIETEAQPLTIERFNELLDKLDALVQASHSRAQADLARSQSQLEVLATLQALIRQQNAAPKGATMDLAPLQTVLTEIQAANAERGRISYEFDVTRNNQGFINKIVATPQGRTLN